MFIPYYAYSQGVSPATGSTIQNPYSVPTVIVGNPGAGASQSYSYFFQGAEFATQPPQDLIAQQSGYLSGPPLASEITIGNWQEKVRFEIARRSAIAGAEIPQSQAIAIMNAYRQVAGLPPVGFSLDSDGAAILDFYRAPTVGEVVASAFQPVNIAQNLSSSFQSVSETASDIAPRLFSTTSLIAAAVIIGGIIYLSR